MNCYSCGKKMWPDEYDGKIAITDGDPRCSECRLNNKPWNLEEKQK